MKLPKGVGRHQLLAKIEKVEKEIASLKGLISKIPEDLQQELIIEDNKKEFVAFFCDRWKERYLHFPKLDGKNLGALRNILKDFGTKRSQDLVTAYLKMVDAEFIRKRHSPVTLMLNMMAVGLYADSGKLVTNDDARQAERAAKTMSLFDQVDQGTL